MHQVILVSGPPGAGKSAVAEAICERFDRMLHIEVDTLRHFVKAGYRQPWAGDQQAAEQLLLAARNAAAIARVAVAARYAAVIDDVVLGPIVDEYREALRDLPVPVHLVTLLPDIETTLAGDRGRSTALPERVRELHAQLTRARDAGELPGALLDTSADADAQFTTDRALDLVASGEALLLAPTGE